jgi:hypothetical protein
MAHEARRMIPEALVKRGFVVLEDLVDAQLMDPAIFRRTQAGR